MNRNDSFEVTIDIMSRICILVKLTFQVRTLTTTKHAESMKIVRLSTVLTPSLVQRL